MTQIRDPGKKYTGPKKYWDAKNVQIILQNL